MPLHPAEPTPTTICVFCGSSPGLSPGYLEAARSLARAFHTHGIRLVYGGGTVGLMGEIAKTLTALSGPDAVQGIIPKALVKYEQAGRPLDEETPGASASASTTVTETGTETGMPDPSADAKAQQIPLPSQEIFGRTTLVSSMHERKQLMTQMVLDGGPGSGFIALPGGYGTLEELAEVTTWNQLGIHGAGIVVFDVEGFWQPLMKWVNDATSAGFISENNKGIIRWAGDAEGCLKELREYQLSRGRFDLDWEER